MKFLLAFLIISSFYLQVQGAIGAPCTLLGGGCDFDKYESCYDDVCACSTTYGQTVNGSCLANTMCNGNPSACSPDGSCNGMFCTCNNGFLGDGGTCESAFACNRTNPCHINAMCENGDNATAYTCTCNPGYFGDGIDCVAPEDEVEIVCSDTDMSITITNSIYDNVTFALQDTSCIFTNNGTHNTYVFTYDTCGTTLTEENDHLIYSNRAETSKNPGAIITRNPDHYIDLVCKLERSVNVTSDQLNVTNFDSINITKDDTTTFTLNLKLYPTDLFTTPYQNHQFPLQMNVRDVVYTEISLDTSNEDVKLIPQNCYATPTSSPFDAIKHYILQNKCGADASYSIMDSTETAFQFAFKAFQFLTTNDVYLHCEILICDRTSSASECRMVCPTRKRREVEQKKIADDALEKYMLASKQIILVQEKNDESTKESLSTNKTIMFASLSIGLLIILAIIFAIVMVYRLKVVNGRNNNADLDMKVVA